MAKIKFEERRLSKKTMAKIEKVNEIIDQYMKQGFSLTLRQLYYQMVARGYIQNNMNEYKSIGEVVKFGRMGGLIDWGAIVDRTRTPKDVFTVGSEKDAIKKALNFFRYERMEGQKVHLEVWCEKDAISNILWKKMNEYGITLMVNRGYSSVTAMFDAAKRISKAEKSGKTTTLLYFGDHDPSGIDMLRDINDRFGVFEEFPELVHIGITMPQIVELEPPPYPAKVTDPRCEGYMKKFGDTAWELDALPPDKLFEILEKEIESRIDMDLFRKKIEEEEAARNNLRMVWDKSKALEEIININKNRGIIVGNLEVKAQAQKILKIKTHMLLQAYKGGYYEDMYQRIKAEEDKFNVHNYEFD